MPYTGHKSITIREDTYDKLREIYENKKMALRKQGVSSFSSWVNGYLLGLAERLERDTP